jgi:N6-adenosine-specific RNA methylase IME4
VTRSSTLLRILASCIEAPRILMQGRLLTTGVGDPSVPFRGKLGAPFRVVVADPPWPFGDKLPGAGRGAAKNYDVLDTAYIRAGRFVGGELLSHVADDAYLFLWRVSAGSGIDELTLAEEAYEVARHWGFAPKTEIVWRKQTKNGARHFGMGWHVRNEHETCIVATRGKVEPLVHNIRSVFDAVAPSGANGRALHSAKPEEFYSEIVEKMRGGPYLELFARRRRPGWTCVGRQLT